MRTLMQLLIFIIFLSTKSFTQDCGSCKTTPKLAVFDFDVQVPQPNAADGTDDLWPEWKALFRLAGHVATQLKNSYGNCIVQTVPPSYDKEDGEELSVGGETFVNLPSNPNISKNLSEYGSYILTGKISKSGNGYNMYVEILSACSRKVVATANVPFALSSLTGNITSVTQKAASQLSPLGEKIKKFEQEERSRNTKYALAGSDAERIKITPAQKKLSTGQQTEITLELKDCDGQPLAGREIFFKEGAVGGMKITGTIGGIVTPAKVVTDVQGRAKATFKMTAAAGKPAIINAHTLTQTPWTCDYALIGSAQIDALNSYKVSVIYQKKGNEGLSMSSDEDRVIFKADYKQNWDVNYSFSLLFYPSAAPKDGEQIMIVPELENTPEIAQKGKTVVLYNDGYSEHTIAKKPLDLIASPVGAPGERTKMEYQRYFSAKPLPPSVSFLFNNNDLVFFSAGVEFPEPEEGLNGVSGSFGIEKNNKQYFPLKPKKVTDPNSPYKWLYEFEFKNQEGYSNGGVISQEKKEVETAIVQIWKTF